jgi:hypothetical protein
MRVQKAYTEETFDVQWELVSLKNDTATLKILFPDPAQIS